MFSESHYLIFLKAIDLTLSSIHQSINSNEFSCWCIHFYAETANLDADTLEGGHTPDLQGLAAQQVGRPDNGHILGRHPRVVVAGRHAEQMPRQVLQGPIGVKILKTRDVTRGSMGRSCQIKEKQKSERVSGVNCP